MATSTREKRVIDQCVESGRIELFSQVLCGINSRPPKDMNAYFAKFVGEAKFVRVPRKTLGKFQHRFGSRITFWRGFGIVMIMGSDEEVLHFIPAKELEVVEPPRPQPIPTGCVFKTPLGYVPNAHKVFYAGLYSQVPDRGRKTPNGYLSRSAKRY